MRPLSDEEELLTLDEALLEIEEPSVALADKDKEADADALSDEEELLTLAEALGDADRLP